MDSVVNEGTYASKQIRSRSRLIAWSHSTRFRIGLELGGDLSGRRILDYGCGDGTYLAMLLDSPGAPIQAVGAEIAEDLVRGNQERLGGRGRLEFVHVHELSDQRFAGAFDALICMEVLEHVLDPDALLQEFHRLLSKDGLLLLSVPVEIGISVVIKQAVRRINGWRGIGDYPGTTPYAWNELLRAVAAGPAQHVSRPIHRNPDGSQFHDHKGFNWRWLRERLRSRFELETLRSSPVSWLHPFFASQVWFRARKKG